MEDIENSENEIVNPVEVEKEDIDINKIILRLQEAGAIKKDEKPARKKRVCKTPYANRGKNKTKELEEEILALKAQIEEMDKIQISEKEEIVSSEIPAVQIDQPIVVEEAPRDYTRRR